jgi:hypothetical protein
MHARSPGELLSTATHGTAQQQQHSQFQTHPIVNFVIFQGDVVLVDGVPLLDLEFFRARPELRGRQLFEIPNRVVGVALDANFLPQAIVQDHFDHFMLLLLFLSSSSWV